MATILTNGVSTAPKEPSWILLTNKLIPSLKKTLRDTTASGVHIYGQGAVLTSGANTWVDNDAETRQFSEWETSTQVCGDVVRVRTGAMNNPPLYAVRNTTTRAWAVGTNAFMLNVARSQWGMFVGFVDPTVINRDSTSSFQGVDQLPSHSSFELKKDDVGWKLSMQEQYDPLFAALHPKIDDFAKAGSAFVSSIQKSISDLTKGDKHIATLLSGGIDSGAVATFASKAGLKVTAYSAGSPWGDEHEEAQQLADYLGIPLIRIDLTAEDLVAAIPDTIRALGTAERERVDIQITISAVMRSGVIKEEHILTGYGNDLMVIGLPPENTADDVLIQDIITEVDLARHSGEFNDFIPRTWGKRVSHVYWHPEVVQIALDIHPACKVRDGREKAFFRAGMEPYMPKEAAWRKKVGIHLGGGMQAGLDALFGGIDGKQRVYHETFKAINERLLADPFANIDHLAPGPIAN